MNLYEQLQKCSSEEDVKDVYIKAIGLKEHRKNLIDIQTKEIWFEAKDGGSVSTYKMFAQLSRYIFEAHKKGEYIPPFLSVIDQCKAAIMKTEHLLPIFEKEKIKWGKSASDVSQDALDKISPQIGPHIVSFNIKTHGDEFIETVKKAISEGDIIRVQITPDNLKTVFDKWTEMVGHEIKGVEEKDYALLFYADIMHDGQMSTHKDLPAELMHKNNSPVFLMDGHTYELGSREGYRRFWAIYHRPPKEEYRTTMLERRDSLIPVDERSFEGAYYTPLKLVEKAYEKLTEALGENWHREYIVWDMCCGVGNLESKHSYPRNIYMSTLDQADIDIMKAAKICTSAVKFQYDYLNDDIDEDGNIDYSIKNKVPESLRKIIKEGKKKILVLINPPYAEATNANNISINSEGNKGGVAKTNVANTMMDGYGKASNELFTQFLVRIQNEIPNAVIGMFSTLKYINAPNFEKFRQKWKAEYLNGFIVHSKSFEGLKGNFPIGFLMWNMTNKKDITEVDVQIYSKDVNPIGEKKYSNVPNSLLLNKWISRPKTNTELIVPLKNATSPYTSKVRVKSWSDEAIAYMYCGVNDIQHATTQTVIFSSTYGGGNGFYVTPEKLWQAAIVFTVRRIIKPTWINDRDQFLQPTGELTEEFKNDCLIWMLFNGSNLTASADDLEWNDQKWSIVNHFIPFTEDEIGSPDRFESDFMVEYLRDKKLSDEAMTVMKEGKNLWQHYFDQDDNRDVRDKLKLNRCDVGWYQVRNALKERNKDDYYIPVSFSKFEEAYKELTEKLRPMVYELGFLKN